MPPPPFSSSSTLTATSASSSSPSSVLSIVSMDVLHFDVPLISTRRASSGHGLNQPNDPSPDTSRRVPFLWERAPGIPKDGGTISKNKSDEEDYTPKPPPGRWRPPNLNGDGGDGASSEEADDAFSDALDNMRMSESFGVPCRLSVSKDTGPGVARAPSFIMKRFLPAANALAASSAANALPRYSNRKVRSGSTDPKKVRSSQQTRVTGEVRKTQYDYGGETTPGRACGIMLLFPWGTKRALCGLKSPVRCQTPKMGSVGPVCGGDYGPGSDDGLSSKAWKSPGWGLPFLDTSRLRRPKGKKSGVDFGEGSPRRRRRGDIGGFNEVGRQLPRLKTPSEPWLANALSSVNRRRP